MAATNKSLLRYDGATGVNALGQVVPWATAESRAAQERDRMNRYYASMAAHNRLVRLGQIASIAIPTAGLGMAAAGGGAAASPLSGAVGTSAKTAISGAALPVAKAGMTAGSLLSHPMTNLAATGVFGWLAQRSQNKANERAQKLQMDLSNRQLQLEQQRLSDERADRLAALDEDKKRWAADELYRNAVLARDNEQATYDRSIGEQRQNRLRTFDPYRQMALARLGRYLR